jgi:hypothetical protein
MKVTDAKVQDKHIADMRSEKARSIARKLWWMALAGVIGAIAAAATNYCMEWAYEKLRAAERGAIEERLPQCNFPVEFP